jgi:hypothetical protein
MIRWATVVTALLISAALALADAPQTGLVTGMVVDSRSEPLPGASVRLEGAQGILVASSAEDGTFRFAIVAPGHYTVRADVAGFQPTAGAIVVSAGGRADVELRLIEAMGDEIVITGEAPLVNRFDMTGGGTITADELEAITGEARGYRSRLLFLPGVHNDVWSDRFRGSNPTIAAVESAGNVFFVDGLDVSDVVWGAGMNLNLPETAVSEMTLESSGADAEMGRTAGAFTRVTVRSGTNRLHGDAQLAMYNLAWNAPNRNVPAERLDEITGGFDATLGGPLVRDRLWFFLSYRAFEAPAHEVMADGVSVVDRAASARSALLKVDWRPKPSHSLSAMYSDTPYDLPLWVPEFTADLETVLRIRSGGDLATARWSWAITDDLLVGAHVGLAGSREHRDPWVASNIEAGCSADQPCGNDWVYLAFDEGLIHNGAYHALGIGSSEYPRDQLNFSLEWFRGRHDLKAGADQQRVAWRAAAVNLPLCAGWGYDERTPGGFLGNLQPDPRYWSVCAFYPTRRAWQEGWGPAEVGSRNTGLFVRDRFTADRWTFNLGLRADTQHHENDVGETTLDGTDWMPRLAASCDLFGNGKVILSASASRYIQYVHLNGAAAFNATPWGDTQFEWHLWNPATQDNDILVRVQGAHAIRDMGQSDTYFKDEATLGAQWQLHSDWAIEARAVYRRVSNFPQILRQMDPVDGLYEVVENTPGLNERRRALELSVHRRFTDGWTVDANYTLSETEANCCGNAYGELISWTLTDGTPVSHWNQWGRVPGDRPHLVKVRGAKRFDLGGGHSILVGGLAYYTSGQVWAPQETWVIPPELDPLGQQPSRVVFLEPRGSRRIGGRAQLDLNLEWRFPIAGSFSGYLRTEVLNVTDEQVLIGIAGLPETGEPYPTTMNYQYPREVRAFVGFSF